MNILNYSPPTLRRNGFELVKVQASDLTPNNLVAREALRLAYSQLYAGTISAEEARKQGVSSVDFMFMYHVNPDDHLVIAATRRDLIGTGTVSEKSGIIDNVAVLPDYRRSKQRQKQVGCTIVASLENHARSTGLSSVSLRPTSSALTFYEKLGYEIEKTASGVLLAHKSLIS